jgi:hypothetical protein
MGKNKKEHRKRVQARNVRIKQEKARLDKVYQNMFKQLMEEKIKTITGKTEQNQIENENQND